MIDFKNLTDLPLSNQALVDRIIKAFELKTPFMHALKRDLTRQYYREIENRIKNNLNFICSYFGEQGQGKCQTAGNKVLMADGTWKNIEDIKIGDEVISPQIDENYTYAKVIGIHSYFEKNVYEVRETTREKRLLYKCSENHEIPVIKKYSPRMHKTGKRNMKRVLGNYIAYELSTPKNNKIGCCSFTTTAINYRQPNSSIDAYCLGAWLGDGHFVAESLGLTTEKKEIIQRFYEIYPDDIIAPNLKKNTMAITYKFSLAGKFALELKRLNLYEKKSGTKFIPKECLLSDINYRKELLAGLIDTDGYIDKKNSISICTKSKQMAEDIKNLVFSLGGYSKINEIKKTIKAINFTGNYFNVLVAFKDANKLPIRLWKKERIKKRTIDPRHIQIKCFKTTPQTVYGIEIDSPSKWYITDNWMITHNSYSAIHTMFVFSENTGIPVSIKDDVCFLASELLYGMQVADEKEIFLLDEQVETMGYGAKREESALTNVQEIVRKKQINLLFSSPDIKDRSHMFVFEALFIDRVNEKNYLIVYKNVREPNPDLKPLGYIKLGLAPQSFLKEYEKKKQRFIDDFLKKQSGGREQELERDAKEMLKSLEFRNAKNFDERLYITMLEHGDLTTHQQRMVTTRANMILRAEREKEIEKKRKAKEVWNDEYEKKWENFTKQVKD